MSSVNEVNSASAVTPSSIPGTVVNSTTSTPPTEKSWSTADIQAYLEEIRLNHQLPIYPYQPEIHDSVMCCLVPPRLEEVFDDYRLHSGYFSFYPHALLIRDWLPATSIDDCSWWREFWPEEEVREAVARRNESSFSDRVNEVHEHSDIVLANIGRVSHHWRACDMADSFDRGHLPQRSYDLWLWWSFYRNPHDFASLACLVNMVRLKQLLWARYRLFFCAATISEVYPENELAEWVRWAYKNNEIALPIYRDEELSFEVRNKFFVNRWPKRIRSYVDEVAIQRVRRNWRTADGVIRCGQVPYFPEITRRIFNGEELPKCMIDAEDRRLAKEKKFWKRRHKPIAEQHAAQEPNRDRWAAQLREMKRRIKEVTESVRSDEEMSELTNDDADDDLLLY